MQRMNFALNTIPHYDRNINTLNNAVNSVLELLGMIQPELDLFEISTIFLAIRSKITGKALESIRFKYKKLGRIKRKPITKFRGQIKLSDNS